ncbi:unnamed protein product [Paramecium octaurelia]|uniref:Uncharacterized protein n=1 Tax=Paramecium octaurelia TaxID=43137 RepID=A0A8S1VWV3_PAROT|nr:unnamed protein product [Paramecium octaurelia]
MTYQCQKNMKLNKCFIIDVFGKLLLFSKEKHIRKTKLMEIMNIEDINPLQANCNNNHKQNFKKIYELTKYLKNQEIKKISLRNPYKIPLNNYHSPPQINLSCLQEPSNILQRIILQMQNLIMINSEIKGIIYCQQKYIFKCMHYMTIWISRVNHQQLIEKALSKVDFFFLQHRQYLQQKYY